MKIESNIPIPKGKSAYAELMKQMQIGDSILCNNASSARASALKYLGKGNYCGKKETADGAVKYRVWKSK